jgi:hypothetical protein
MAIRDWRMRELQNSTYTTFHFGSTIVGLWVIGASRPSQFRFLHNCQAQDARCVQAQALTPFLLPNDTVLRSLHKSAPNELIPKEPLLLRSKWPTIQFNLHPKSPRNRLSQLRLMKKSRKKRQAMAWAACQESCTRRCGPYAMCFRITAYPSKGTSG